MPNQSYVNADGVAFSLTTTPTSTLTTFWSAQGPNQTLTGDSGDDNFVLFDPTDKVVLPPKHGIYTITDSAWDAAYTLPTGINNLVVNGGSQLATGNAQANLIETGTNTATVSGGGGDDVFVLGTGAVTIIDAQGSGNDVVYGFNASIDHIRLDGSTAFTGWSAIQTALKQVGSDVVLNMGNGQTLTFRNMTVGAFTSSDFYLPINTSAFTKTFDDEFTTFVSSPTGDYGWMTSFPYDGINNRAFPGDQDATYYSDSSVGYNPFKVVNGVLDITATTAAAAGGNPDGLPYESGAINTYKSESQLYGYFEIRAQLPAGTGLWPSFYMQSYDGSAELDIFEILGKAPTVLYPSATDHATGASTTNAIVIPNSSTGFHTYGVDWEPDTVTFYMDGNVIASAPTPASMHVPMYMIVGMGVGAQGSWASPPTSNSIFPATMQIDYVRAYATAATQDVGGTQAIPVPISVTETAAAVTSANGASVHPFNGVVITDINANQTETATVTPSSTANGTLSDPNAATDGGKLVNGIWTMTGSSAAVAAALDGLVFIPKAGQTTASVTTAVTATIENTSGDPNAITTTITATKPVPSAHTLTLQVSENTTDTDAQFTVAVNGAQVGGIYTANALHWSGDSNTITLTGNWNSGVDNVTINFINPATARYLYVNGIAMDGTTYAGTSGAMLTSGSRALYVGGSTATAAGPTDTLKLSLSEDQYLGVNALFELFIDGKQVSTPQSVTAVHSLNATQDFTFTGSFGAGAHTVGVDFLNDGWGGPGLDRNLYINGVSINGANVTSGVTVQAYTGTANFAISTAH